MAKHEILEQYDFLKKEIKKGVATENVSNILLEIHDSTTHYLSSVEKIELKSLVREKQYIAFKGENGKITRAVNSGLFVDDGGGFKEILSTLQNGTIDQKFSSQEITAELYTAAIKFCASIDLLKTNDQKTPGTFFEYFAAHIFSQTFGIEPTNAIQVMNFDGEDAKLPTDNVFNLGQDKRKFHMPVKTSTRERAIMLWAHQKLLDGVFGNGRFIGTPVLLAETKKDTKKLEVTEICLPSQWRLYQLYIAKISRIYYMDIPQAYVGLSDMFPALHVKTIGDFFFEWKEIQ